MLRKNIIGMFVGGAVGDSCGLAVETWNPERIVKTHGVITGYVDPIDHKYFTSDPSDSTKTYMPIGSITDDTQLTIATMKGIINGHLEASEKSSFTPYMDAIAQAHVAAMNDNINGWGNSTVEAIRRIEKGVHWSESGKTDLPGRGTGNGIPMKCSPFVFFQINCGDTLIRPNQALVDFAAMTHYTQMAAHSGIIHNLALHSNLLGYDLPSAIFKNIWLWEKSKTTGAWNADHLNQTEHNLRYVFDKLKALHDSDLKDKTVDELRAEFGNGSCYVYDSLPFSYAFFLRNPNSVQCILDVINAGGDTDTNGKMVGELVGSLHGIDIFLQEENRWMVDRLLCFDEIVSLANQLCDLFGIE
jgi:ADP-ribosyl-[dinitrogen reductase] hydrolase